MCAPSQGAMLPYSLKIPSPYFPFGPSSGSLGQTHLSALDFQRSQINDYNVRVQLGLRNYPNSLGLSPFHSYITDPYSQAFFYKHDPRARFVQEEPKPSHSYIGLIAMAILSSKEKKLVLSDIYQWILDNYPYFRSRGPGWRNSIRHNLSLNDCFIKSGRSANGKGHYWAVHPANVEDFERGDFRRRRAQRKVRRHMGLSVPDDDDSPSPSPTQPWPMGIEPGRPGLEPTSPQGDHKGLTIPHSTPVDALMLGHGGPTFLPALRKPSKRRLFDMASILAPDDDDDVEREIDVKRTREDAPEISRSVRSCESVSPHVIQTASPCRRYDGCCGSDVCDEENDNDDEEIEVASLPGSPATKDIDGSFRKDQHLSVNVSHSNINTDLSPRPATISSQIEDSALDLSSPSSAEVELRSPSVSSPRPGRVEFVDVSKVSRSGTNSSLAVRNNEQPDRLRSRPVSPTICDPSMRRHGVDKSETTIQKSLNTSPCDDHNKISSSAGVFEQRPELDFFPPSSNLGFDLSKLSPENLNYFRLQLQHGGSKRLSNFPPGHLGPSDPRYDLKQLAIREAAAGLPAFPGVDPRVLPDILAASCLQHSDRHLSTPDVTRIASMGVRWTHPALQARPGPVPARDGLGMFSLGGTTRPPAMYSPFHGMVNFPLPPQRSTTLPPQQLAVARTTMANHPSPNTNLPLTISTTSTAPSTTGPQSPQAVGPVASAAAVAASVTAGQAKVEGGNISRNSIDESISHNRASSEDTCKPQE